MRIRAITIRIIRQFIKDKRTLALLLIAPLLVLTLVHLVFNGQAVDPKIGTVQLPAPAVNALSSAGAETVAYDNLDAAMAALADDKLDAVITMQNGLPSVTLEGSSPTDNRNAMSAIQEAMKHLLGMENAGAELKIDFLHGSGDIGIVDYYGSVLVGFFSFFFVFLIAGVSFLRERTSGTLQRLLATPLRRWEVVVGYLLGFGIFTLLQATLIAWYATSVLGFALEGSLLLVLLMNLLLAISALTLGTLLSAYANNEFQVIQFIPIVVVPQIFFAGLIEMETMPEWLQAIGQALPLYYGANALRDIMLRGAGWSDIWTDALVLLLFSLVFAVLNVLALRKHRRV